MTEQAQIKQIVYQAQTKKKKSANLFTNLLDLHNPI